MRPVNLHQSHVVTLQSIKASSTIGIIHSLSVLLIRNRDHRILLLIIMISSIYTSKVLINRSWLVSHTRVDRQFTIFDQAFEYSFWPFDRERIICVRWSLAASRECPKMQIFDRVGGAAAPPWRTPPRNDSFLVKGRARKPRRKLTILPFRFFSPTFFSVAVIRNRDHPKSCLLR